MRVRQNSSPVYLGRLRASLSRILPAFSPQKDRSERPTATRHPLVARMRFGALPGGEEVVSGGNDRQQRGDFDRAFLVEKDAGQEYLVFGGGDFREYGPTVNGPEVGTGGAAGLDIRLGTGALRLNSIDVILPMGRPGLLDRGLARLIAG